MLFLDEPTTGLDSFTSNEVMLVVKNMVRVVWGGMDALCSRGAATALASV